MPPLLVVALGFLAALVIGGPSSNRQLPARTRDRDDEDNSELDQTEENLRARVNVDDEESTDSDTGPSTSLTSSSSSTSLTSSSSSTSWNEGARGAMALRPREERRQAAVLLRDYRRNGGSDRNRIAGWQNTIGVWPDGVVGPVTRAAARSVGVEL